MKNNGLILEFIKEKKSSFDAYGTFFMVLVFGQCVLNSFTGYRRCDWMKLGQQLASGKPIQWFCLVDIKSTCAQLNVPEKNMNKNMRMKAFIYIYMQRWMTLIDLLFCCFCSFISVFMVKYSPCSAVYRLQLTSNECDLCK